MAGAGDAIGQEQPVAGRGEFGEVREEEIAAVLEQDEQGGDATQQIEGDGSL